MSKQYLVKSAYARSAECIAPARTLVLIALLVSLQASPRLRAQAPNQLRAVRMLKSDDWPTRARAVEQLQSLAAGRWSPQLRERILHLYAYELQRLDAKLDGSVPPDTYPEIGQEPFADYFGALGSLVMRGDGDRGLQLLIATPSEPMASSNKVLAAYGARVLPLVLGRVNQLGRIRFRSPEYTGPDYQSQMAMADILGQMLQLSAQGRLTPPLSAANLADIRSALRPYLWSPNLDVRFWTAGPLALARDHEDAAAIRQVYARRLRDPHPIERLLALEHLANISDPAFIPAGALREVAKADPYNGPVPGTATNTPYPLRGRADAILRRLSPPPNR